MKGRLNQKNTYNGTFTNGSGQKIDAFIEFVAGKGWAIRDMTSKVLDTTFYKSVKDMSGRFVLAKREVAAEVNAG